MTARSLLALCFLAPSLAMAQGDDWSSFPSAPPAPPPPVEVEKAVKEGVKEEKPPAPTPTPAATAPVPSEPVVVSRDERVVPGTEPHSPSTWGRPLRFASNRRLTPSALGAVGLFSTSSATLGPKGLLRISVLGEYFTATDFPVQRASHVRSAGTFAASYVPVEFLEVFLAYGASANTNSLSSPTLIQALGDLTFGAKASREWTPGFSAGLDLRLQSFSGVGTQNVTGYAWGFSPRAVVSYDVRSSAPSVPVVLHANAGIQLDGTGGLVRHHTLNAAEEFALGVHRYNRFVGNAALEVPLPVVTPFLEYDVGVPLGVSNRGLLSPDQSRYVNVTEAMPQRLGLGMKITAVKDLTFVTGAQLGLARTVGMGVPATQPWNVYLGASFNVDPFARGEGRVVETMLERTIAQVVEAAPKTAKVEGTVVDKQTGQPLPGVIVAMVGAGLPPVASDAEGGRFLTHDLNEGPVTLKAVKAGYREAQAEVVLAAGSTATVQLALEPEEKRAQFLVTVTANMANAKRPLPAQVKFKGPVEQALQTTGQGVEPAKLEVPPGKYVVTVVAAEHLAQTREVQVGDNGRMDLLFELDPEPKKRQAIVRENRIDILQQVRFATNKATILPASHGLLNEVVDVIVKNDIQRVRVEGHTDNRGGKGVNQRLSEERAKAVANYLVQRGIDPSRIDTAGFGDTRPLAPNLTARGRELNRRVEFHIADR